jgi:hypothetical protein
MSKPVFEFIMTRKMIKHIVVFRLKENAHGNTREQNALIIKSKLEALKDKVPGIIRLEVGIDFSKAETSGDIVLYSEFASKADLENYQAHPDHLAVKPFVMEARSERRMVDYEVQG